MALAAGPLLPASLTADPALVAGLAVALATGTATVALVYATRCAAASTAGTSCSPSAAPQSAGSAAVSSPFWLAFAGMVVLTAVAWRRFSPALLDVAEPVPLGADHPDAAGR